MMQEAEKVADTAVRKKNLALVGTGRELALRSKHASRHRRRASAKSISFFSVIGIG